MSLAKRECNLGMARGDAITDQETPGAFLVVGVGASAGGLEAFTAFLSQVPENSGIAFVLVQHLDPNHDSMLVDLLGKATHMPVVQAEDGLPVEPDTVFVIQPNSTLTIEDGVLGVANPAPPRHLRRPIDTFLSSLAEDQGEFAVGVILSGSGSDGSLGIRTIKENGGLTVAQAVYDATAMSGMPGSAAATGLVDHVLPVEEMPAKLIEYRQHLIKVGERKDADGTRRDVASHVEEICTILRGRCGHDFSQYKGKTLVRRIQRRMQVLEIEDATQYVEILRKDAEQTELLFRDLLIGVTEFFRDPEAFAALGSQILPILLRGKGPDDEIRIWVPGCASGEEAYSIAILLAEAMMGREAVRKVVIFGSDIDENAIALARNACFSKTVTGLSPERLERWFVKEGDNYYVTRQIRDMCVFSVHSLVKDPPFSKLDLISCRNLLIYLEAGLQGRIASTFHYALKPGGYLFLGPSETMTRHARLFVARDKKQRIFQRRDEAASSFPEFGWSGGNRAPRHAPPVPPNRTGPDGLERRLRRVVEKYAPAYVVLNENYDILRFSGRTGRYLGPSTGAARLALLDMIQSSLRPAALTALRKAAASGRRVVEENLAFEGNGSSQYVDLIVEPIASETGMTDHYVVAFRDREPRQPAASGEDATADGGGIQELEQALLATRGQLQTTIDEMETANEEMRSTNEEYQSVIEELQSSNEELETSKEEIQSINEELQTVNAELHNKNQALIRANSDLQNLLDNTQIATIFLDDDLRIRSFTPATQDLFHLRDGDRGRPITDIVSRLDYGDLKAAVEKVARDLSMIEQHIKVASNGASYIMRIRPYRTIENVIDGVVITFTDVTARVQQEVDRAKLAAIVDSSSDAIIGHSLDGRITSWNRGAEAIFGFSAEEAIDQPMAILLGPAQADNVPAILARLQRGETVEHFEIDRVRQDHAPVDVSITVSPVVDGNGRMIAASTVARAVTARKAAEEQKNVLIAELDHRIKNILSVVMALISQSQRSAVSPEAFVSSIDGRIKALSRVHGLLTNKSWDEASLRDIVEAELAPYRSEQKTNIVVEDEATIALTPKATQTLALAFHELATNAAKYGALTVNDGSVGVRWSVSGPSAKLVLRIVWAESNGPAVTPPARRGFGSALIERALATELNAEVKLDFAAEGLKCEFDIPLTAAVGTLRNAPDEGR